MGFAAQIELRFTGKADYLIAVPLMLMVQWLAVAIGQSDWWPPIGRELLGL